ncbi:MAG: hypothetical protein A3G25_01555 [Betaproteobacteria bacterium RIFCSPLOWO2_12_FULL_63_13]|nr:MAG: hypothetical protein A3G25_01555 [Betaproteobacteria bacterium RIFCSPLOWO2_12_FULL_63_13]
MKKVEERASNNCLLPMDKSLTLQRGTKHGGVAPPSRFRSDDLFQGRTEVVIVHHGREYRLRLTQNDKLILTA